MPAMRRDAIQRLCRCECAARAVRVVLIPTGLGRALRRYECRIRRRHDQSEHLLHERRGIAADRKQRLPGSRIVLREPIMAHAPEAVTRTQPEPFIVSLLFLRPVPPNWQVACGIYPQVRRVLPYYQGFSPGN
jgi:hypothetical protein